MDTQQSTTLPTKENTTDSTKPLLKLTPLEISLQSQNQNYKNQIKILEEKVSYYENEHFQRTSTLTSKLKNITQNESKLTQELSHANIKLSKFEKENKYLKAQLSEMEQSVLTFKREVKELYKQIQSNAQNSSPISTTANSTVEYDTRINEMISLLKQYSNEISKLKNENVNLSQTLSNYIHNPPTPREICEDNNDSSKVREITSMINTEILFISQWIDTYMSANYDKNFEVPSLLEEQSENTFYINFDMLKSSLENSRRRINEELNSQEKTLQDMKSMVSLSEVKQVQLKNEISELRNKIYFQNENEYQLKEQIQSNSKQLKAQNEKIDYLSSSIDTMKKEYTSYLENIFNQISKEINNILHDSTFKAFHENIISTSEVTAGKTAKRVELLLSNSVDKLLQFIGELKFDYAKTKEENIKHLTDTISTSVGKSENVNLINKELVDANKKIDELEEMISKVSSENTLMRNQIEFIEQNNKVKQKNEGDLKKEYDSMAKKLGEYEMMVKAKDNEIAILKEKNRMLVEKGERDKKKIDELKEIEEKGIKVEIENEKIKKDYNRLVDENNVLRKLNQNSIIKK